MPQLGLSRDRRALSHISEVFTDDSVQVLMCFLCACKELSHSGFDKFGRPMQKGNICFRKDTQATLRIIRGDPKYQSRRSVDIQHVSQALQGPFRCCGC